LTRFLCFVVIASSLRRLFLDDAAEEAKLFRRHAAAPLDVADIDLRDVQACGKVSLRQAGLLACRPQLLPGFRVPPLALLREFEQFTQRTGLETAPLFDNTCKLSQAITLSSYRRRRV
jgi:hypothetical protein